MMVLSAPIDWTAKMAALYSWATNALGTGVYVQWADQDVVRPDFPFVTLDITSGPTKEGGVDEISESTDLTRARDAKIVPLAQNGTTYTVSINGNNAVFVSDADATIAEITSGLKTAIDSLSENVVTTDNGTDLDVQGIPETLNPGTPQLFNITVTDDFDGSQISWTNNDTGNEIKVEVKGQRQFTLNVQAFVRNTISDNQASDPSRNAHHYLTVLQSSLGLPTVQSQLRASGIAMVEELPVTDLSEEVEDTIESRASMDVRMRTTSILEEYIGYIENVSGTGTIQAGTEEISTPYSTN